MNWLAHFALSPPHDRVRLGNWLADLFTADELKKITDRDIQRGLALHRIIDQTTDRHPRVRAVLSGLPPGLRRGGGIILDVFWDHFLTCEFTHRIGCRLDPFVDEVLAGLERTIARAPPGTQPVFQRMQAEDWLRCYATVEGVELTLTRISGRLSPRAQAVISPRLAGEFLRANRDRLAREFSLLWPDLTAAVARSERDRQTHELEP